MGARAFSSLADSSLFSKSTVCDAACSASAANCEAGGAQLPRSGRDWSWLDECLYALLGVVPLVVMHRARLNSTVEGHQSSIMCQVTLCDFDIENVHRVNSGGCPFGNTTDDNFCFRFVPACAFCTYLRPQVRTFALLFRSQAKRLTSSSMKLTSNP